MPLQKSEKAKTEIASKTRTLTLRERSALFLVDGVRTRAQIQDQLQDDGSILEKLLVEGYLIPPEPGAVPATPALAVASPAIATTTSAASANETLRPQGDNFDGKRSLATTRMFLFDICERMFARKDPDMAARLRERLRDARDRASMLIVSQDILASVEAVAGAERADGLSERIAMLLPSEQ
ncbi:hypothetical protein [Polaromonas sp. YR568]|uniref:hypothetical protein n=1 Tax=Polaromonas sp. YR568 TaxID=1855301 RepID=UPI0031377E5F